MEKMYPVVSEEEATKMPYPWVYVHDDGSVSELNAKDPKYLETPFLPWDGARPYLKFSYDQKDGWGSMQGFCLRSEIPNDFPIGDARPSND